MDILNIISWIKNKRYVTSVDSATTLIPVGMKDDRRDDGYLAGVISVENLATQLNINKLVDDTRQVVLTDNTGFAELTFNTGSAIIQTTGTSSDLTISTLSGDDIIIESGDDIILRGDKGTYDQDIEGGDINIYAGEGSDGNTVDAGNGGDIRIQAGDAGSSLSGAQSVGGVITIQGGYTTEIGQNGGSISLFAGNSVSNIPGEIIIGGNYQWLFNEGNASLMFPTVTLATLPNPVLAAGARAMISDSNVVASGNFGAIAATGGSNIVPVFSNGTNWLIG